MRILGSVIVFGFLFLITSEIWQPLHRALGGLLLPLGQNALLAYAIHVPLAYGSYYVLSLIAGSIPSCAASLGDATLQVTTVAFVWLLCRQRWKAIRARKVITIPSPRDRLGAASV